MPGGQRLHQCVTRQHTGQASVLGDRKIPLSSGEHECDRMLQRLASVEGSKVGHHPVGDVLGRCSRVPSLDGACGAKLPPSWDGVFHSGTRLASTMNEADAPARDVSRASSAGSGFRNPI